MYRVVEVKSLSGVIKQLKYHRSIHIAYINKPQLRKGNSGDEKHHKKAVLMYSRMIKYLTDLYNKGSR